MVKFSRPSNCCLVSSGLSFSSTSAMALLKVSQLMAVFSQLAKSFLLSMWNAMASPGTSTRVSRSSSRLWICPITCSWSVLSMKESSLPTGLRYRCFILGFFSHLDNATY